MRLKQQIKNEQGFSIVEIAVVIVILSLSLITILGISVYSLRAQIGMRQSAQAGDYAKDAIEAVKSFRDRTVWNANGIGSLATGSNYYPILVTANASSSWLMASGTEAIAPFSRTVVFNRVSRDPVTDNIETVYNTSNDDPETRKMTVTVTWPDDVIQITTYLADWK